MKKFVAALVAASMLATPAIASAAPQNHRAQTQTVVKHKPNGKVVVTQKKVVKRAPVQYRSWKKGQRFDSRYARNYRQVDYRGFHGRLKAPPRGYRYVQSGNDVVMVSIAGGIIGAIFANLVR